DGSVTEPELGPGRGLVTRREDMVIDARRHDLDARRVGAVEASELDALVDGRSEDGVGATDHLGLGPGPLLGLVLAGFGLRAGEGVGRRHERQLALVLEGVTADGG